MNSVLTVVENEAQLFTHLQRIGTDVTLRTEDIDWATLMTGPHTGWQLQGMDGQKAPTILALLQSGAVRLVHKESSEPVSGLAELFAKDELILVDSTGKPVLHVYDMSHVFALGSGFFRILARYFHSTSPALRLDWKAPSLWQDAGDIIHILDEDGYSLLRACREPMTQQAGLEGMTLTIAFQGSKGKIANFRRLSKPLPPFMALLLPEGDTERAVINPHIVRTHDATVLGDGNRIEKSTGSNQGNRASLVVMNRQGMELELVRADEEYAQQRAKEGLDPMDRPASLEFLLVSPAARRAALRLGMCGNHLNELGSLIEFDRGLLLKLAASF